MRLFVTGNRVRCNKTENSKTDESHKDSSRQAGALNTITKFFETVNAREKHVFQPFLYFNIINIETVIEVWA